MWNEPTKERLAKMPKLYETEKVPLRDKLVYLHFFISGCDWFICEFDGEDTFFGFCILNNDLDMAEWGYVSLSELKAVRVDGWLELDCEIEEIWKIRKASEIDKIRKAHGWPKSNGSPQDLSKEQELILKIKAGHFLHFQDLLSEIASPYSDFFGIDPYPIWEAANGHKTD